MLELADPDFFALIGGVSGVQRRAASPTRAANRGVTTVTDRIAFNALEGEWRALEERAPGAILFQSFAFCRAVFDHHERNRRAFAPLIVTLRERGRLVGILPLHTVGSGRKRIATGFGEPYQQYTDVILSPDAPENAAARLLDAACRLPDCAGIHLLKVRDDTALAPLLRARRALKSNEDAAPFVDLRPFPDFKAYHATVKPKTRKNIRNARNRLAHRGALSHSVHADPKNIGALIERAHQGRERWLSELGLTSRAFRDPTFGDFAAALAMPGSGLDLMAMSLVLDGQPIADQWGFVFNERYYAYVATWAPEFEDASPGKLHLEEVIRACHARGVGIADFLMPAVRYKFTWTDHAVQVADYAIPLSLGARLKFSLWSGHVRPLLKRIALRLPAGFRSRAARLLLRR